MPTENIANGTKVLRVCCEAPLDFFTFATSHGQIVVMRTAMRYIAIIAVAIISIFAFLAVFNIFQFGICNVFPSTCGTTADHLIWGWAGYGSEMKWVPGKGWEPVYNPI